MSDPSDIPPVLKVKKDAEREIRYHYRRDERVALKQPSRRDRQRGGRFTRLLRGRGKSLLPVLLGVLAIGLAGYLLTRDQSVGHLAGYDLSLRAYEYEHALLASVTVSWKPRAGERAAEAADATVRFSTPGSGCRVGHDRTAGRRGGRGAREAGLHRARAAGRRGGRDRREDGAADGGGRQTLTVRCAPPYAGVGRG